MCKLKCLKAWYVFAEVLFSWQLYRDSDWPPVAITWSAGLHHWSLTNQTAPRPGIAWLATHSWIRSEDAESAAVVSGVSVRQPIVSPPLWPVCVWPPSQSRPSTWCCGCGAASSSPRCASSPRSTTATRWSAASATPASTRGPLTAASASAVTRTTCAPRRSWSKRCVSGVCRVGRRSDKQINYENQSWVFIGGLELECYTQTNRWSYSRVGK